MQRPDAYTALVSGGTPVDVAFLNSPFQELALADPKIHKITDSFEIQGAPESWKDYLFEPAQAFAGD